MPREPGSTDRSGPVRPKLEADPGGRPGEYDFNLLERSAADLIDAGRPRDAMAIYLYMADGDPSLDAGYLAMRIGDCCERLGDLHAAKWWYGRAVEENPTIEDHVEARRKLDGLSIDPLLTPS